MRPWALVLCVVVSVILQSVVFHYLRILGAKPDLLLVLTVFAGFIRGPGLGSLVGLLGGFLEDMISGRLIGASALSLMITGYLVGLAEDKLFKDNLVVPVMLVAIATLLHEGIYFLMVWSFGFRFSVELMVKEIALPCAFYNALVAALAYSRIARAVFGFDGWSDRGLGGRA